MKLVAGLLSVLTTATLMLVACGQNASVPASGGSGVAPSASASTGASQASSASGAAASASQPKASAPVPGGANPKSPTRLTGGDPNGSPVRISFASVVVSDLPFYGGIGAGFFQQEHLNVTMILAPPNVAITAVGKGEIDFTDSPGNAIEGATRGLPMKLVFSAWQKAAWTIVGKMEYKSLAELKGKTIGTNQAGSSPYLYLRAALKRSGLSLNDVKIVSAPGTADTYGQLVGGVLDAAVVSPPFDAMAIDKGFHEVEFIGDALELPYIGLGGNNTFVSEHHAQAVALMRALMNGDRWLKAHPAEATDLAVKYVGAPAETLRKSIDKMLPLLSDTGEASPLGVTQALAIQEELTNRKIDLTPDQVVDYGPLHEALSRQ